MTEYDPFAFSLCFLRVFFCVFFVSSFVLLSFLCLVFLSFECSLLLSVCFLVSALCLELFSFEFSLYRVAFSFECYLA